MRCLRRGAGLRHEQCADEERVIGELKDARLTVAVTAADAQARVFELRYAVSAQAEAAVVTLLGSRRVITAPCPAVLLELHLEGLADEGAAQARHEQPVRVLGIRAVLGMARVGNTQHPARIFERHVLKAAASTDRRDTASPGE